MVEDGRLVGVVSLRDLMGVARIRPATETSGDVPAGLEGVVVAETTVGDVRGQEGFFHYRQYSAVDLAEQRSLEDVWHLLFRGELPDAAASDAFAAEVRPLRTLPPGLATLLPGIARAQGAPLDVLRTAVSRARGRARLATDPRHRRRRAVRPGARAVRRRPDHPGGRPPAPARATSPWSRATTSASPPTTSTC